MADIAHTQTDKLIEELERRLEQEYKQANEEVQKKLENYFARFKAKDERNRKKVLAGTMTEEEYEKWRYGQICVGERWKELKQNLAEDYVNRNSIARSIINEYTPEAYALNHNYATYQVEHDSLMDTSYTLYNREAVENILKDDPTLLPYPYKESPKAKLLRERADLIWNRQKINSAIVQGILQGESIPEISKRLRKVTDMNKVSAVRNARTMMTAAENKGRQDAYDRMKSKGIDLQEMWVATLDSRTRYSHRHLHGTYKDPKTGEYENGLRYPADPMGEPEEIYNCRCCEIAEVEGFKIPVAETSPKLGGMSFEQWQNAKGTRENVWWNRTQKQEETHRITLHDIGTAPKRPRKDDYWKPTEDDPYAGYNDWEKARDAYKKERKEWEEKRDRFVEESLPKKSMTVAEMNDWCKKNNAMVYGDISQVDGRALTVVTDRMEKLFADFPMVQEYYGKYGRKYEFAFELNSDFLAEASNGFTYGKQWRDLESVVRYEIAGADGFRVLGDGTVNQVIDHEFGHSLYSAMRNSLAEYDKYGSYTSESWDRINDLRKDLIDSVYKKNGMSEYATTNDDELFAEAFSAWYGGEKTDFALGMEKFLRRRGIIK